MIMILITNNFKNKKVLNEIKIQEWNQSTTFGVFKNTLNWVHLKYSNLSNNLKNY